MKIAFVHNDKKISTGAHYINDLISQKFTEKEHEISNFYPKTSLIDTPVHLKGLANILFFYSLLEYKNKILKYDIIQGTTYTPLPFLAFDIPVISHFGSTTQGFLKSVPLTSNLDEGADIFYELKKLKVIDSVNLRTRRPMRDIVEIEHYTASKADGIIATSEIVKGDLVRSGIDAKKIYIVHNAIEDYWFEKTEFVFRKEPALVFIGRIGGDPFNLKLKGFDRLMHIYSQFGDMEKFSYAMTTNKKLVEWMLNKIPRHRVFPNAKKDTIPAQLQEHFGSIQILTSRYEGFSLSLIEGMSQGLIPITFEVGVAPEIIKNGVNGFIVKTEKEACKIIRELTSNNTLRKKVALKAQETARQFTATRMIDEMTHVYKQILLYRKKSTAT